MDALLKNLNADEIKPGGYTELPLQQTRPPMSSKSSAAKNGRLLSRLRALLAGSSNAEAEIARKEAALAHRAVTQAVRETMATAGILSSHYRLKVLSTLGSQKKLALVVNVLEGPPLGAEKMGALERRIATLARSRADLEIIAMYWRWSQFVAEPSAAPAPMQSGQKHEKADSPLEAARRARLAEAERLMRERDQAWASTMVDDDYTPPEASNSDLMPLI